ncbi:hypothetical protein NMY22_g4346 [Coprinellus aureogranulatus]|nr:hypothetical protein NMY22_g4346 [Coprinellus aureogranulatus]
MGGGDLNMKKSWHPLLLKNQERVWLEEKKALEEKKKLDQLRKEKEEERQLQELQRLQEEQTGKKRTDKLEWMYATPASGSAANPNDLEDYLLGKKRVDKILTADEHAKLGASHKNFIAVQNANNARDIAAKIREDPLLAIKQQEQAALQALANNPLRLRELQERNGIKTKKEKNHKKKEKEERKRLKREKHDRKHRRSSRSRSASRSPVERSRSPSRPEAKHRLPSSGSRRSPGHSSHRDFRRRGLAHHAHSIMSQNGGIRKSHKNTVAESARGEEDMTVTMGHFRGTTPDDPRPHKKHRQSGPEVVARMGVTGIVRKSLIINVAGLTDHLHRPSGTAMAVLTSPPPHPSKPAQSSEDDRAAKLAAMRSNAVSMQAERQVRLAAMLEKEKAELAEEDEKRKKGVSSYLTAESKKVFGGAGGLEDRIRRGRGGMVIDAD